MYLVPYLIAVTDIEKISPLLNSNNKDLIYRIQKVDYVSMITTTHNFMENTTDFFNNCYFQIITDNLTR